MRGHFTSLDRRDTAQQVQRRDDAGTKERHTMSGNTLRHSAGSAVTRVALAAFVLMVALSGLLAGARSTQAAESQLDQSVSGANAAYAYQSFKGNYAPAQTFTAGITGDLDKVRVMVLAEQNVGDLTAEIRKLDASGRPAGDLLGSGSVLPPTHRGVYNWVSITLDEPAPVTRGTQYALVLRAPNSTDDYLWSIEWSAPYAGGNSWMYYDLPDGSFTWASRPRDLWFETYVVWTDATAPVITVPGNFTAEAAGASGAVVAYSASATDAVDGTVAVSCSPSSGGTFAPGVTTVTCSATDAAGNTGSASFTVTVRDSTEPALSGMPSDMTLEATDPSGAVATYTAPSATDKVDGAITPSCKPASGSTFGLGTTEVTCEATDDAGNIGKASFTITVQDTTEPVLSGLPSDMNLEATGPSGATARWDAPTASDKVDGAIAVACKPASGSTFGLGATTITCEASDKAGNTDSGSFTVTVRDTTKPVLSGMPSDITLEATGPAGATASWDAPTASDTVDGAITPTCSPVSGSTFALGATTVICSATDSSGNSDSDSFSITVQDTTKPVVRMPADITVNATSPAGTVVTYSASATDTVDGAITPTCSPASGTTFAQGIATVRCEATDEAGNSGSASFTVTVKDASTQVADQEVLIQGMAGVSAGAKASLTDKLGEIGESVEAGEIKAACNQLDAYVNQIEALRGKKQIARQDASLLIENASRIQAVLGC